MKDIGPPRENINPKPTKVVTVIFPPITSNTLPGILKKAFPQTDDALLILGIYWHME